MPDLEFPPFFGSGSAPFARWLEQDDAWSASYGDWIVEYFEEFQELVEGRWFGALQTLAPFHQQIAFQSCMEDFISFEDEEEGNVVDAYLEQNGAFVGSAEEECLGAVRGSLVSLYEVKEATPQSHLVVIDLLRKGAPFTIHDALGSSSVVAGNLFAARVIKVGTANRLTGAIMMLDGDTASGLLEAFEEMVKGALKEVPKALRKDLQQISLARQAVMEFFSSLVTAVWLQRHLEDGPLHPALDSVADGLEQKLFLTYPLPDPAAALGALSACPDLKPVVRTEPHWLWGKEALLWIRGDYLDVETNSDERLSRLQALLSGLLGKNLGTPMESADPFEEDGADQPIDLLSAEEARLSMIDEFEEYYRQIYGEPVEDLGDRVPRDLASTPEGRQELAQWLRAQPEVQMISTMDGYDIGWLWREWGLEDLRQ